MTLIKRACAALLLALTTAAGSAELADPVATVNAFADALRKGDAATVTQLLAPDVLIYESGGQEASRDEYASHHMKGDMNFLASAQIERLDQKAFVQGDIAVVATRSGIAGASKDKSIDVLSTETITLKNAGGAWQIVHVHWSSRPRNPAPK